jgi:hypothetical protein
VTVDPSCAAAERLLGPAGRPGITASTPGARDLRRWLRTWHLDRCPRCYRYALREAGAPTREPWPPGRPT